jgi:DNA-binding NtrC family response regulator
MSQNTILIVDDEAGIRIAVGRFLRTNGYRVEEAVSCKEAERVFRATAPDAVLLDMNLPDGSGVDLLPRLREISPEVPVIMLTGFGSVETAVQAIKQGAEQFLTKPVELPAVLVLLERLMTSRRDRRNRLAGRSQNARDGLDPFLGESKAIRRLAEEARKVAASEVPVLIQGETGSGKGVLARWLHAQGPRSEEAMVEMNCASFSKDLLDSELFGHEKGAFTGATSSKMGLLELAHRGTVFLDEIGDMDHGVQPKLLKALEDKRIRRVGDVRDRHVDFRLIAATHQDLEQRAREERFRRDLLYRINTFVLPVPPLRERVEDIPVLAQRLLEIGAREAGRGPVRLSPEVVGALVAHPWPGNVRELKNVLERALVVSDRPLVELGDLRFGFDAAREPSPDGDLSGTLEEIERRAITAALHREGGSVEAAARCLAVSKSGLYLKIKKYGLRTSMK